MTGLDIAYRNRKVRSFVAATAVGLALTLGSILVASALVAAIAGLPAFYAAAPATFMQIQRAADRLGALAGGGASSWRSRSRRSTGSRPRSRCRDWRLFSAGTLVATVLWLASSSAFSLYVSWFGLLRRHLWIARRRRRDDAVALGVERRHTGRRHGRRSPAGADLMTTVRSPSARSKLTTGRMGAVLEGLPDLLQGRSAAPRRPTRHSRGCSIRPSRCICLVATDGTEIVGIVHFIFHRSTWTPGDYCYLQDLFTSRGRARKGCRPRADRRRRRARQGTHGASRVHWLTHETNAQAMILYDQVAEKPGFVQYRIVL